MKQYYPHFIYNIDYMCATIRNKLNKIFIC